MDVHSTTASGNIETRSWRDWYPGLANSELTLRAVYDALPDLGFEATEQLVRLLESPASPYAVPEAQCLLDHNCIRIALGRGLLNQDEAFVVGYAMGTTRDDIRGAPVQAFRRATRLLYKPPYRMSDSDLVAFDLAFALGAKSDVRHIVAFDFERAMDLELGDIRKELAIDVAVLKAAFRQERLLLPGNKASERLPVI